VLLLLGSTGVELLCSSVLVCARRYGRVMPTPNATTTFAIEFGNRTHWSPSESPESWLARRPIRLPFDGSPVELAHATATKSPPREEMEAAAALTLQRAFRKRQVWLAQARRQVAELTTAVREMPAKPTRAVVYSGGATPPKPLPTPPAVPEKCKTAVSHRPNPAAGPLPMALEGGVGTPLERGWQHAEGGVQLQLTGSREHKALMKVYSASTDTWCVPPAPLPACYALHITPSFPSLFPFLLSSSALHVHAVLTHAPVPLGGEFDVDYSVVLSVLRTHCKGTRPGARWQ